MKHTWARVDAEIRKLRRKQALADLEELRGQPLPPLSEAAMRAVGIQPRRGSAIAAEAAE